MSHIAFAYLRGGGVYRDHESWEQGDRLGTYAIVFGREGRHVETDPVGGRRYRGLWIWSDKDEEEGRDHGTIPLLALED